MSTLLQNQMIGSSCIASSEMISSSSLNLFETCLSLITPPLSSWKPSCQVANRHRRRSWTAITQLRMQVSPTSSCLSHSLAFTLPIRQFAFACPSNPFFQPTKRRPASPTCLTLTRRLTIPSTTSPSPRPALPDPNVQLGRLFTVRAHLDRTIATDPTTTTTLVPPRLLTLDQLDLLLLLQPGHQLTIGRSPSPSTSTRATTTLDPRRMRSRTLEEIVRGSAISALPVRCFKRSISIVLSKFCHTLVRPGQFLFNSLHTLLICLLLLYLLFSQLSLLALFYHHFAFHVKSNTNVIQTIQCIVEVSLSMLYFTTQYL